MKKLIVNADDFGLCTAINRGIIEAHKQGIVTSASLVANMPGFDDAVAKAKKNMRLDIGFHINLVSGKPLSDARDVQSLVDKNGEFIGSPSLLMRLFSGRLAVPEIESEIFLQFERIEKACLGVSHINSHQHVHLFPKICGAAIKLAKEKGIKGMRYQRERIGGISGVFTANNLKRALIASFAALQKKKLEENRLVFPKNFFGIMHMYKKDYIKEYGILLDSLPETTSELMCHPGYNSNELEKFRHDTYTQTLEHELYALKSRELKEKIKKNNIELTTFREI